MMPSRGLRIARGNAPRLFQLQCRNLSSASRRIPISTPLRNALSITERSRQWQTSIPISAATSHAIRHASTTPQTPTNPPAPPPEPPLTSTSPAEASSAFPNMDTITLDSIDLSSATTLTPDQIAAVPEKIGYLHDIGLNYGFGPTSLLEWVIEHFHIYAGLPWWGSIAATAVLLRLVLFPLYLKSSDSMARTQALMPVTKPITDRMSAGRGAKDNDEVMKAWSELRAIRKRAGIRMRDQFLPIVAQGIFGYCGFKLLRAAAYLPVPAFRTDGFWWLTDMTVPDPYLILPAVMAGCIHMLVRMGGETGAQNTMTPGMQQMMLWGMPGVIFLVTGWQPGAVCVWFAAGGALGIIQSLALQKPQVRRFFGIAPLYKAKKADQDRGPLAGILEGFGSGKKRANASGGGSRGKNTAYMKPTYQSPNLRHTSTSKPSWAEGTIDVKAVPRSRNNNSDEMISPNPSTKTKPDGVFDKASKSWTAFRKSTAGYLDSTRESLNDRMGNTEEGRAKREREAFKREARNYEERMKQRGRKR
ncbi:hypothetical protein LTR37_014566 [Vermiconidia calcicola]|uniref:Uncharacterized protein n=1 Tax=Vermiconidia calcicola TaxID=1690605 RepID=A0ACC3MT77_9PEZI|nr:hypothetical protein LTR37_014566 [Vermiconidia calcicola]